MIPYRTAFIVLVVSLSASFPARAAEDKTGEQIREFNRALVYHQRFLDDARSKVTVDPAREKALAAFRISVEPLAKLTGPELTKQLDRCQKDLEAIESFLPVEGDRIARTEAEEEAKTLAALNPGPGWNMGVSVLSFGRFGWNTTDGLLCDTVAFESRKTTKEDEQLGRVPSADLQISDLGCDVTFPETNLRLSLAPAGAKALKARVADISWIGKHFILDADAQKDVGQVYTSLQRPATRFVYRSPEVTCVWQGIDPAR